MLLASSTLPLANARTQCLVDEPNHRARFLVDAYFRGSTLRIEHRQFLEHPKHFRNTRPVPYNVIYFIVLRSIETSETPIETPLRTFEANAPIHLRTVKDVPIRPMPCSRSPGQWRSRPAAPSRR